MNRFLKRSARPSCLAALIALAAPAASLQAAPPLPAPAPQANPQIEQAVAALRAISSLQADFIQTDRNGQRVSGVITLQRPGKIRFQYQKGVPLLIVSDGSALTMIDYEVRQVQRWPIRNSPLGALLDPNKDVARYAALNRTGHPDVVSLEVRDPRHPEYGTIDMVFSANPVALTKWIITDDIGNQTSVTLGEMQGGQSLSSNLFSMELELTKRAP